MSALASISGMTGFGRADGVQESLRWTWEAKSVNGRTLDVKLRLPSGFDVLDPAARAGAAKRFKRGSVQMNLTIARESAGGAALIDKAFLDYLLAEGKPYFDAGKVALPTWDGLLQVRGVLTAEEGEAMNEEQRVALEAALIAGLDAALDALAAARAAEGRMLAATLDAQADRLDQLIAAARASAAAAPAAALERIRQRLAGLSPEIVIDPQRLAQEAAIAASRADVAEELDRLSAHAKELRSLLTKSEPAGRRLDFLGQELTREANTLCSKSADLELTRIGLDLKTVVDQIKEQAANVE